MVKYDKFEGCVIYMRVLIIEDEKRLACTLADILEQDGYQSDIAGDGGMGYELAASGVYDGIILDVMLPVMNGFEVLRRLRKEKVETPVVMLTARSDVSDRVQGLDAGADYYLTKPFENEELLACLRAVLRRRAEIVPDMLEFGDIGLTPSSSKISCKGEEMLLSARELELMRILIENQGQFLSKEILLRKIWGYDADVNANSVEAYVSFLRKKLHLLHSIVQIKVTRNLGYRLEEGI